MQRRTAASWRPFSYIGQLRLNGFFPWEEYHARDLEGYYGALAAHPHHNYYEGALTLI